MWSSEFAGVAMHASAMPVWLIGLAVALLSLCIVLNLARRHPMGARLLPGAALVLLIAAAPWVWPQDTGSEQRRALEARLATLQSRAQTAGSALPCLDAAIGAAVEAGCERSLFATPESIAAASAFTAERLALLGDGLAFAGRRTPQFDQALEGLRRAIEQDRFGLVANVLALQEGCTAEQCDHLVLLRDPARVQENLERQAFEQHVARHAAAWGMPQIAQPGPPSLPTRGIPLADKYVLPSSDSIPPVSIMNNEPDAASAGANSGAREANSSPRQAPKAGEAGARAKPAAAKPTNIAPLSYAQ